MNFLGSMPMPIAYINERDEIINLYKTLGMALQSMVKATKLQQDLMIKYPNDTMLNAGRIILFTPGKYRSLHDIQQFMIEAVNECNKNIEQANNSSM
jgi:hypothetical protein